MHITPISVRGAQPITCPPKLVDRRTARRLIEVTVAGALGLPVDELCARTRRTAPIAFARQVAMYCAHVTLGWSLTEAGAAFDRDRTTAAHACRVVEDRRDDPQIDSIVQMVEDTISDWHSKVGACSALKLDIDQ